MQFKFIASAQKQLGTNWHLSVDRTRPNRLHTHKHIHSKYIHTFRLLYNKADTLRSGHTP